jgi:penicillin-binding protein 1A
LSKRRDTSREGAAALDLRLTPADRPAPADAGRRAGKIDSSAEETPQEKPRRQKRSESTARATKSKGSGRTNRAGGLGALTLGRFVYWGAVLSVWGAIGVAGLFGWVAMHLPPIQSLEIPKRPPTIQINAADGHIFALRGEMGGAAVALKEMPAHLPNAFIAIEDRRFYSHYGVDPIGLVRAVLANLLHRGIAQGGSTITQQLAKNLFLTPERNMMRKLQEVVLALWLEHHFTKKEILELYLNRVYFGSGAYGVEAAAQRYFGKPARNVTLAEAALLAGLVKSPSRLAPNKNYEAAEQRGQIVLATMVEAGLVKEDAAKAAVAAAPAIVKPSAGGSSNYVADYVMDVLNDLIGRVDDDVVVDTTIDAGLQAAAERAMLEQLAQKGDKAGVQQGALVAMTPDGAVRALVGGRSYAENQFNRAVVAKRQPGSAFKPFVYLTALEHGLTPDTVRDDKPVEVKGWRPENFNREYAGPVTLTQALAHSLNSVSVRLAVEFGPTAVVRTAHRLGIASKLEPNASIALGTSEVSVLELVSAYAPFANGGIAVIPRVVERVRVPHGGKVLYARTQTTLGRVVDARYVAMMNQMMRETVTSGTARHAELPGWAVAGKTGTSQDFRDAWFVGYTSQFVAGVWLGNDDNTPTRKTTGGSLPVDVWSQFMRVAHRGKAPPEAPTIASLFGFGSGGAQAGGTPAPAGSGLAGPGGGGVVGPGVAVPGVAIPGVAVPGGAGLASLGSGGGAGSVSGSAAASGGAPRPVGGPRGREPVRPQEGTMDGWFLERLFSRH